MSAHDRGIHRQVPIDQACTVGSLMQALLHEVPSAVVGHTLMPLPHCLPQPEYFREVAPGDAAAVTGLRSRLKPQGSRSVTHLMRRRFMARTGQQATPIVRCSYEPIWMQLHG